MIPCPVCRCFVEPRLLYEDVYIDALEEPIDNVFVGRICPLCDLNLSMRED